MAKSLVKDTISVLQKTLNFMTIDLMHESLKPSSDMERQEIIEDIQSIIDKLKLVNSEGDFLKETLFCSPGNYGDPSEPKGGAKLGSCDAAIISNESKVEVDEKFSKGDEGSAFSFAEMQSVAKRIGRCSVSEIKDDAVIAGYLYKHKKKVFTKWHRRFCILKNCFLFYYKTELDNAELGVIVLPSYNIQIQIEKANTFCFTLAPRDRKARAYMFMADRQDEFEKWCQCIQSVFSAQLSKRQTELLASIDCQANDAEDDVSDGSSISKFDADEDMYDDVSIRPPAESAFSLRNVFVGSYPCRGSCSQELSFKRGDVLYLLERVDANWGVACLNGKVGFVPSKYLTKAFKLEGQPALDVPW